jgi:hypothetical protein
MRLSRRLVGAAAAPPNFILFYSRPDQFPGYLARRLHLSTRLARLAHTYLFLFRPEQRLYVSGAFAQRGTGTGGSIDRDPQGRVVYSSYDAAHLRLGSYYLGDKGVCFAWDRRLRELVAGTGATIPDLLPVNGTLANVMADCESATEWTDALLNRVFGQLETALHPVMRNLLLHEVPEGLEAFGAALERLTDSCPRLLMHFLNRRARERLQAISQDPSKEQLQSGSPHRMFASESELLRAIVEQTGEGVGTRRELAQYQRYSHLDIRDELHDIRLAQEELSALTAV